MGKAKINYFDHPVFDEKRLHLITPAMSKLLEEVLRWLWTGATGGLIIGMSRVGKTTALLDLIPKLYTRGKVQIPTYYISIPTRDKSTIASLFRELCYSVNLRVTNYDRPADLSDRYVHFISDQLVMKKCKSAVLIVDEAQRLIPIQFNAFAELYDKLLRMDITLTVIFAANDPECWSLIEAIEEPHYAHIHGRFFTQGTRFLGITSKDEVKYCLTQYDTLRYPVKGPTYTEYFLPEAFQNGWRLAMLSNDLWRVFREYQKNYHIKSWGMKYFTSVTNTLLTDFLPRCDLENINDDVIHEYFKISGLIPSLVRPVK